MFQDLILTLNVKTNKLEVLDLTTLIIFSSDRSLRISKLCLSKDISFQMFAGTLNPSKPPNTTSTLLTL